MEGDDRLAKEQSSKDSMKNMSTNMYTIQQFIWTVVFGLKMENKGLLKEKMEGDDRLAKEQSAKDGSPTEARLPKKMEVDDLRSKELSTKDDSPTELGLRRKKEGDDLRAKEPSMKGRKPRNSISRPQLVVDNPPLFILRTLLLWSCILVPLSFWFNSTFRPRPTMDMENETCLDTACSTKNLENFEALNKKMEKGFDGGCGGGFDALNKKMDKGFDELNMQLKSLRERFDLVDGGCGGLRCGGLDSVTTGLEGVAGDVDVGGAGVLEDKLEL